MPINFVTGLPRTGKTLLTFQRVRARAEAEKRPVFYCNIPEVTIPGWTEIDHPDKWMDCPNDAIIIVDELQDFWGANPSGSKVPMPILELSKHGKRGIDFYFITQDPTLVHNTPRKLCETHYHVIRAFGSNNAMVHKFAGMQTDPSKVKSKAESIPWRYPSEAFGKRDKAGNVITPAWYKSADVHNIKRSIPIKVWAIPGGVVFAGLMIWAAVHLMGNTLDKATNGAKSAAAATGATGAQPIGNQPRGATPQGQAAPMTTAQYLDVRTPRIADFPNTAPVYDRVTEPVEAPYPAACLQNRYGCKCWSQQATLLQVSASVCVQIVAQGFFMDWRKPQQQEQRQAAQPMATTGPSDAQIVRAAPARPVTVAAADPVPEAPKAIVRRPAASGAR